MLRLLTTSTVLAAAIVAVPAESADPKPAANITWKKTVLDTKFRAEGVAAADVNKDGKIDVLNGEYWYEAPGWSPHEMRPPKDFGDGAAGYSRSFACWAEDLNRDGYPDLIVIDFPGAPCYWMENPKGDPKAHWKQHEIWHSACNETPLYADLLGTGKRVLVMGSQPPGKGNQGQMAYFSPDPKDPNAKWVMHPLSPPSSPGKEIPGTQRFSHGLGVGDINGDGRADVMTSGATTGGVGGWWEQPEKPDGKTPWAFHPLQLPVACADMFAYDISGDGKADIIASSAHGYGIWAFQRRGDGVEKVDLFPKLVSQTHALHCVDINGDGLRDLVTGKRWWAHGPKGDADPNAPAKIYWFEAKKAADGVISFTPHEIDADSGIGTQFEVSDINGDGLLDIISSNKKGVRVIVQQRK